MPIAMPSPPPPLCLRQSKYIKVQAHNKYIYNCTQHKGGGDVHIIVINLTQEAQKLEAKAEDLTLNYLIINIPTWSSILYAETHRLHISVYLINCLFTFIPKCSLILHDRLNPFYTSQAMNCTLI